jgi:hypothetical protein
MANMAYASTFTNIDHIRTSPSWMYAPGLNEQALYRGSRRGAEAELSLNVCRSPRGPKLDPVAGDTVGLHLRPPKDL